MPKLRGLSQPYRALLPLGSIVMMLFLLSPAQAAQAKRIPKSGPFKLDFLTFYGFFDNSPPGTAIAHPEIHSHAAGTGTFNDPITFAVAPQVQNIMKPGIRMYIPSFKKYFVMEDDCTSSGPGGVPEQGVGCDGELKDGVNEFDIWIGGAKGDSQSKFFACEDRLTTNDIQVIIAPADGLPVDTTPLFKKNKCIR